MAEKKESLDLSGISFTIDPLSPRTVIFMVELDEDNVYSVRVDFEGKQTSVKLEAALVMLAEGIEAAAGQLEARKKLVGTTKPAPLLDAHGKPIFGFGRPQ